MIVEWIRAGLTKPGKSKIGLAAALDRAPSAVSALLKGERELKANEIEIISRYLEIDPPSFGHRKALGPPPSLSEFPFIAREKLRYGDTDRQGHVNNAVFATFLETGRVEMLFNCGVDLMGENGAFVLARLLLDFRREVNWPGEVEIGTRVAGLGRSSLQFGQAVFQDGQCVATAETTVVLTDVTTRRSKPFSDAARVFLQRKPES